MNKAILIILDGWGLGNKGKSDAIAQANTPFMDNLYATYPNSKLLACGENVGLPDGQMGNSEVGHLNIGSGRVVYQDLVRINKAIKDDSIAGNNVLNDAFSYAKENKKAVHFIGLIGSGGVHSMSNHLYKLCDLTKNFRLNDVFIHALTDGRDTDPRSGYAFMKELVDHLKISNGEIASVAGRYYTMDRDKRWERIREGYDLMVFGKGKPYHDVLKAIEDSYSDGITDEFIKPVVITDKKGAPIGTIKEGDVVICFNYRTDRLRQITSVLTQKDITDHGMKAMPLYYLTLTTYDENFKGIKVIFDKQKIENTMGEIVSKAGLKQIRIAETEKYAHVTFFFNGGRESEFEGEERILIPSPKVPTYDLQPEMSAPEVTDAIVFELKKAQVEFVCLNFANCDMVGHTGVYGAILLAIETVDMCVKKVVEAARLNDYTVMIIADHGNADYVLNDDDSPNTAHSLNPVPCILISDKYKHIRNGILADIAPTLLTIMGLSVPSEMTGKVLIN
jgi:2,3-bisphosphoglycerate-independent phosphoglycerate mutase